MLEPLFDDIAAMAKPALFNIYFAFASIPIGFVLAIGVALVRRSKRPIASRIAGGFVFAFRGSPLFIQLFAVYSLVLSLNLSVWQPMGISGFVLHPLFLGPLVLVMNTTAYASEIFYGAIGAVPKAEIEAARAFGMGPWQRFRSVIWPNMIRIAWPAYTNEVIFLFHATALVYFALPVVNQQNDLMRMATQLFQRDYNVFLHFSVAALYFLAISLAIFLVFDWVYRRLMRHTSVELPRRIRFAPRYMR